jgi:hypothetical protein
MIRTISLKKKQAFDTRLAQSYIAFTETNMGYDAAEHESFEAMIHPYHV